MRRTLLALGLAGALLLTGAEGSCGSSDLAGQRCSHVGDTKARNGKVYKCRKAKGEHSPSWHRVSRVPGPPRPRPSVSVIWGP